MFGSPSETMPIENNPQGGASEGGQQIIASIIEKLPTDKDGKTAGSEGPSTFEFYAFPLMSVTVRPTDCSFKLDDSCWLTQNVHSFVYFSRCLFYCFYNDFDNKS